MTSIYSASVVKQVMCWHQLWYMNYFNVCTYTIASLLLVNLDCTGCNREHHGKVEK